MVGKALEVPVADGTEGEEHPDELVDFSFEERMDNWLDARILLGRAWILLTEREKEVLRKRFAEEKTLAESLAESGEGVSVERIRQIEGKALWKIRDAFHRTTYEKVYVDEEVSFTKARPFSNRRKRAVRPDPPQPKKKRSPRAWEHPVSTPRVIPDIPARAMGFRNYSLLNTPAPAPVSTVVCVVGAPWPRFIVRCGVVIDRWASK